MPISNEAATSGRDSTFRTIDRYQPGVVAELHAVLDGKATPPYPLMRYHLGWEDETGSAIEARSGKMLRPALCLLTCEAVGGDWHIAVPAAAAIELLHNFTLIHDDVEDRSTRRHGRPTLWSIWGEAQAINAGDGMFALAYATLLRLSQHGHDPERVLRAVQMLDAATLHLCEGQHRDLLGAAASETTSTAYLEMIEGKTAELIATSCAIGAVIGGASEQDCNTLYEFGRRTGLAFQIQDDVLGIWGDAEETGKSADDDLREAKKSYPIVIALEESTPERDRLADLLAQASRSDTDVAQAREILEALGVRERSEQAALDHADAATASLDHVELGPQFRAELAHIATFAAHRSA